MLFTSLGHRVMVRYARKPIWMPTAPSKLFRIPEHTFYGEAEIEQIKKLHIAYKAQMESIENYMNKEFYIPATQAGGIPIGFIEKELDESRKIYEENERMNAEVKKKREKFFENQIREIEDKVMEEKLSIEEALIESGQKMDEYVKKSKSDPNSFVTPDNIDAQIDNALENPVTYEFFIDRQGRKHGLASTSQTRQER